MASVLLSHGVWFLCKQQCRSVLNGWEPSCIVGGCEDCRVLSHIVKMWLMKGLHNLCYWDRGKKSDWMRVAVLQGTVGWEKQEGLCSGWELSRVARVRGVSCLKGAALQHGTALKAVCKSYRAWQARGKWNKEESIYRHVLLSCHIWFLLVLPPVEWRPSLPRCFCESINPVGDKEPLPTKQPQESGSPIIRKDEGLVRTDLLVMRGLEGLWPLHCICSTFPPWLSGPWPSMELISDIISWSK